MHIIFDTKHHIALLFNLILGTYGMHKTGNDETLLLAISKELHSLQLWFEFHFFMQYTAPYMDTKYLCYWLYL